jgi:hypothetical protein
LCHKFHGKSKTKYNRKSSLCLWDFRFLRWCSWGLKSLWMRRYVFGWLVPNMTAGRDWGGFSWLKCLPEAQSFSVRSAYGVNICEHAMGR